MRYRGLVALLPLACGPAVPSEDPESASGGATEPGPDESTSAEASSSADESTSSDDREPQCGDGIVDPDEACDDGNDRNADGCSAVCQVSGSLAWSRPLAPGFAVGLTSRDGAAVAAVQQVQGIVPAVVLAGFDAEGISRGVFVDAGGLSDLDIARNPVELLPDGRVALAYLVSDGTSVVRHFGVLDLESGTVAGHLSDQPWRRTFGVATDAEAITVLRSDAQGDLVSEAFDASATRQWRTPLHLSAGTERPLAEGGVLRRAVSGTMAVTHRDDDVLTTLGISTRPNQLSPLAEVPEGARPAAFSDGVRAWIWTGETLLETDEDTRVVQSGPRSFDGELLWADAYGLVVASGTDLVLYDEAGIERVTVPLPSHPDTGDALEPRFVRPDLEGAGLFVLADQGIPPDLDDRPLALHYLVR